MQWIYAIIFVTQETSNIAVFCTHLNCLDILGAICQFYFHLLRLSKPVITISPSRYMWETDERMDAALVATSCGRDGYQSSRRCSRSWWDNWAGCTAWTEMLWQCTSFIEEEYQQHHSAAECTTGLRCCNTWQHLTFFSCFSCLPKLSLLLWFLCALYVCSILFFVVSKDPFNQSST
jgi:hypothetical protein